MNKYIAPYIKEIKLLEENSMMLVAQSSYADEQYSNTRTEENTGSQSIWGD